ncbi:glycoside hydrolase family 71 protein [Laetiporus sulphureus 93-53]|uniref:Glycoside hydrolase family 71 protein n=1 Tax=Laetiporus sulphureus 93-53 TaxID=1314785 RepID=A0A165BVM9_9APHY|nr:glycoside hydrolase family 71 protein [Laetiporus sulphureus 93-53]KZT01735.1 glycoside hydrolase family 71 protein [Laetiporus sulphureus 93-53]
MFSSFVLLTLAGVAPPLPLSPSRHHSAAVSPKTKRDTSRKLVVAHHILGSTYPYIQDDWLADTTSPTSPACMAFHSILALTLGSLPELRMQNSGTGFKLFMSFDMSVLPCGDASDASTLTMYITTYASHPNQLTKNVQVFASTFSSLDCTFPQSSAAEGWTTLLIDQLTGSNAMHFVSAFLVDASSFSTFDAVMDGVFKQSMDTIIANRDSIDVVEVITFNNYGESHYIRTIEGVQPNSQN